MIVEPRTGLLATFNDKGEIDTGDTLSNEMFYRIGGTISLMKELVHSSYNPLNDVETYPKMCQILWVSVLQITENPPAGAFRRSDKYQLAMGKFATSRDQELMAIIYCAMWDQQRLIQIRNFLKMWKWRYPNGELVFLEYGVVMKRAFQEKEAHLCKLPLWAYDLWLLGNSFLRIGWLPRYQHDYDFGNGKRGGKLIWRMKPDDTGDDKIHIALLAMIEYFNKHTFISRFAKWIYFKLRPKNFGTPYAEAHEIPRALNPKTRHVRGALLFYYRSDSGNNPEIADLWQRVVDWVYAGNKKKV